MWLVAVVVLALSRSELVERMTAPIIIKEQGLLAVVAECSADLRKEYQLPISAYAANICRRLYAGHRLSPRRFERPAVVVVLGDGRERNTNVFTRVRRQGNRQVSRIYVPAPAYADLQRLRLETVKAFFLAVDGRELDDEVAWRLYLEADPSARAELRYDELNRWFKGEIGPDGDENAFRLLQAVIEPGVTRDEDVLRFASRLYFYPATFAAPFAGNRHECSFAEAIELLPDEPRLRASAQVKLSQLSALGVGRGDEFNCAIAAYNDFLVAFAMGETDQSRLRHLLAKAEVALEHAFEVSHKTFKGRE